MHTAFAVQERMFDIEIAGRPSSRAALLDWEVRDRLGVLIDRPVGALGAGLLVLLAITAFYDAGGGKRRRRPLYPDIFLIHVGGRWGPFVAFDFWPDHKEVFTSDNPSDVLRTVNHLGVTHLALPDRIATPHVHRYKEPEAAHDRLKRCFAYSPYGLVEGADVVLTGTDPLLLDNYDGVLDCDLFAKGRTGPNPEAIPPLLRTASVEEARLAESYLRTRLPELQKAHAVHRSTVERIAAGRRDGRLVESLRRLTVRDALERLAPVEA